MTKGYPGAKNGSGIIPWLINNIPYHEHVLIQELIKNDPAAVAHFMAMLE